GAVDARALERLLRSTDRELVDLGAARVGRSRLAVEARPRSTSPRAPARSGSSALCDRCASADLPRIERAFPVSVASARDGDALPPRKMARSYASATSLGGS